MRNFRFAASVLAAAALLCGPLTTRAMFAQSSKPPVLIGVPLPLTGNLAKNGNDLLAGIEFAADEINKSGGVDGRDVKVVARDTRGDPAEAVHAATALITQDNVTALVGGYGSTPDMAMLKAIARYNKIFMHASSSSLTLAEAFGAEKWYFHIYIWDPYRASGMKSFLSTLRPQPKTIALAHESGLYGSTGSALVADELKKAGYAVPVDVPFTTGSADLTPVIQQVKSTNPDVFFWIGYATDNGLMARQAEQQHLGAKLMIDVASSETIDVYGQEVAQGVGSLGLWSSGMRVKGLDRWTNGIKTAQHLAEVSQTNAQGYAAMITLLDAMRSAHSLDQDKVIAKLEKDTYWTPFGSLRYRDYTYGTAHVLHQLIMPENQTLVQYRGNGSVVVWPASTANARVAYPAKYKE